MSALSLRDYQVDVLDKLRAAFANKHRAVMLYAPTGGGKCLGFDTPVLMANGQIKAVQDISVGDSLLSPYGAKLTVLSLARGREMLYRVTPKKGDSYVVNESHILSLRKKTGSDGITLADGSSIGKNDDVCNVSVRNLLASNKTARHCLKGWRSDAVEFHYKGDSFLLDPYWLGVWLGDGKASCASICKPECKMVDWWIAHAEKLGYSVSRSEYREGDCPSWNVVGRGGYNIFNGALATYDLLNNKHIPADYKYSSIENRRKLIAGLIDSDGSLTHNGYDWISKYESLANDFAFLCRSVGLSAYVTPCTKGIKERGFIGNYWRVYVSGDTDTIPCLDKMSVARRQKKRSQVHGISVEPIGVGDYYGFELDGDKLFLLGDFTVTHNTEMAISLMDAVATKGNRAAMILDRILLCDQTSTRLQKYSIDHGVLQSGHWRYRPDRKIQVCSAQTLEAMGSFPDMNLMIVDEAHTQRSKTTAFIRNNPHIRVVGLSASPFTKGLGSIYSHVVSTTTTKQLVDGGWLAPLKVFCAKEIDMKGANKVAGEWSAKEATARGVQITGDIVSEWVKKTHEIFGGPRKTIVFAAGVAHGADLQQKFGEAGYNFISISYKDDDEYKKQVIEDFSRPDTTINGLIATDILTKGFDVADVEIIISARPFTKSFSSWVQQLGRGMRPFPGKKFCVVLDHSGNFLRFQDPWDELYCSGVLELDDAAEKPKTEPTDFEKEKAKCPKCGSFWPGKSDMCPHCGHVRPRRNDVTEVAGEMVALESASKVEKYDSATKERWYNELLGFAETKGYASGWAYHQYIAKFKVGPAWKKQAIPVSLEVLNWITSQNIRRAKGRRS